MNCHWSEVPDVHLDLWIEMVHNFDNTHSGHVKRVQENMDAVARHFYRNYHGGYHDLVKDIMLRSQMHDDSKRQNPEFIPYVWRYYRTTWRNKGMSDTRVKDFMQDPSLIKAIDDAITHHVLNNRHHPEYHRTPDDMSYADIIEMCCDWYAMSQEHGTSIDDWVRDVIPNRFAFRKSADTVYVTIALLKELR